MTELEKWVRKVSLNRTAPISFQVSQAKFWVVSLFDEIESRAKQLALANSHGVPHDPNFSDYSQAYEDLRCELMGTGRRSETAIKD